MVYTEQVGRRVPVLLARPGERVRQLNREGDFVASRANSVERMVREEAAREMRVRGIRGKNAQALVSMVVEGTITSARHFRADLLRHRARLRRELENSASTATPASSEIGAPWAAWHTLRHTFASLQLARGTNILQLSRATRAPLAGVYARALPSPDGWGAGARAGSRRRVAGQRAGQRGPTETAAERVPGVHPHARRRGA